MIIKDIDIPSGWTRGWVFGREAVFAPRRAVVVAPLTGGWDYEIYGIRNDAVVTRDGPVARVADFQAACIAVELLFTER